MDFLVREEDGTSHLVLEDDSGDLLLEESTGQARPFVNITVGTS